MNLWWPLLLGAVVGMWAAHILTAMFAIPHVASVAVVVGSIILGPIVAAFVVAHRARR